MNIEVGQVFRRKDKIELEGVTDLFCSCLNTFAQYPAIERVLFFMKTETLTWAIIFVHSTFRKGGFQFVKRLFTSEFTFSLA